MSSDLVWAARCGGWLPWIEPGPEPRRPLPHAGRGATESRPARVLKPGFEARNRVSRHTLTAGRRTRVGVLLLRLLLGGLSFPAVVARPVEPVHAHFDPAADPRQHGLGGGGDRLLDHRPLARLEPG